MTDEATNKLALSHMWVAFAAFIVACFMGLYQVLERSEIIAIIESPTVYFASVSTHGVLMAYVFTTFFIMGFGYYTAVTSLKQPVWNKVLAWDPYELAMILGGLVLLASACLFIYILAKTQTGNVTESDRTVEYAEPIHPVVHLPELLNDFRIWNWTILVFMVVAFAYPILQFFFLDTFDSNAWGY